MTVTSVNTSPAAASTVAMSASLTRPPEASPGEPRQVQPIRAGVRARPCWAVGAAVATHGPARVLDDVGQGAGHAPCAWSTVSCMVSSFRFGGGMGSRPRRAHSRLGGVLAAALFAHDPAALGGHVMAGLGGDGAAGGRG